MAPHEEFQAVKSCDQRPLRCCVDVVLSASRPLRRCRPPIRFCDRVRSSPHCHQARTFTHLPRPLTNCVRMAVRLGQPGRNCRFGVVCWHGDAGGICHPVYPRFSLKAGCTTHPPQVRTTRKASGALTGPCYASACTRHWAGNVANRGPVKWKELGPSLGQHARPHERAPECLGWFGLGPEFLDALGPGRYRESNSATGVPRAMGPGITSTPGCRGTSIRTGFKAPSICL